MLFLLFKRVIIHTFFSLKYLRIVLIGLIYNYTYNTRATTTCYLNGIMLNIYCLYILNKIHLRLG